MLGQRKSAHTTPLFLKHRFDHIARLIAMGVYALGHSARDEGDLLPRPSPGRAESATHFIFAFIPTHVNDEALGHHISSIDRNQAQYSIFYHHSKMSNSNTNMPAVYGTQPTNNPRPQQVPTKTESKKAEEQQLSSAKLGAWLANRDDRPVYCLRYGSNNNNNNTSS
ncbi:hypothetical protein Q7P35_010949 [Cladosporium inversicolor]